MEIRINEDGSAKVTTAGYIAFYDEEGRLKSALGSPVNTTGDLDPPPQRLTDILSPNLIKLASRRKAAKEPADTTSDTFKVYDAGITLAVDTGAKARIAADGFKVFNVAGKVYMKGAVDAKAIRASHDDHIRQIVREEIRQFVTRESGRGGLFSKW
ncbi:hypothetical protein [Xenorhabdus bovienii]|uniref:Uncharacterized protein n=1 Tax=Xenorhabdus bovienii str. Intermedium TaxID=1379677 RepID=A0A077QLU1_XENBV|nr:hypothetical protein [Xenorhabdus bovienii]CDH34228.1 conserved hypothetical protein [Xenorhabdus bovienii str. Intermedium]